MRVFSPDATIEKASAAPVESPLRRLAEEFAESRLALLGLALLAIIAIAAIAAPFISPQNPYDLAQLDVLDSKLAPGERSTSTGAIYWLGTDDQGRDMLSGVFYGLRISLTVGVASTLIAVALGLTLGLMGAYFGGWLDALIMRIADIQLSFPAILIALILLALLGQGAGKIIVALVTVQWAYYARTVRSAALVERQKEYIEAAQVLALGLPITEPSLGLLIANGFQYLLSGKYWISFYPGLALLVTIMAINLVADQLRDILNPRLKR
jgi:peptide/nickel transport system permease protein